MWPITNLNYLAALYRRVRQKKSVTIAKGDRPDFGPGRVPAVDPPLGAAAAPTTSARRMTGRLKTAMRRIVVGIDVCKGATISFAGGEDFFLVYRGGKTMRLSLLFGTERADPFIPGEDAIPSLEFLFLK